MLELICGDCLEKLKALPDSSVDALVTDPPAGISFMGKEWDSNKGGRKEWIAWLSSVMVECKRVMKPGAHGLVWAIPRTSHWTATALEDAGFEVRDVVTHLFGSGFPKSLDVSKAIDKAAGAEREKFKKSIAYSDSACWGIPNKSSDGSYDESSFNTHAEKISAGNGMRWDSRPSTPEAKQWQGWGTALKPASEHWILVRKPIEEKTVAANVLKHGCGGINIDGSRIPGTIQVVPQPEFNSPTGMTYGMKTGEGRNGEYSRSEGRFPANLVLSHSPYCTDIQCDIECAIKQLDEQSGPCKTGGSIVKTNCGNSIFGKRAVETKMNTDGGTGASRFFYCAKISTSERGAGNNHPTVKPKKLMAYLIKLITPPNGVVLDPFMGSGSTGIACKELGFDFIGIEKQPEYFEIAKKRVS